MHVFTGGSSHVNLQLRRQAECLAHLPGSESETFLQGKRLLDMRKTSFMVYEYGYFFNSQLA